MIEHRYARGARPINLWSVFAPPLEVEDHHTGSWYKIEARGKDTTEIRIYDEIGVFGVTSAEFVRELNAISTPHISLRINSPGGQVFDGLAIYNALKRHDARVTTHVDGLAASMGSVIAMAGDKVHAAESSMIMIHKPWSLVIGNDDDLQDMIDLLRNKLNPMIAGIYARKTGHEPDDILDAMASETWYTAQEAEDIGYVDAIDGAPDGDNVEAQLQTRVFDFSGFKNPPVDIEDKEQTPRDDIAEICRRRLALARHAV